MTKPYCCYCKRPLTSPKDRSSLAMTKDHVMPKSWGGRRKVPCCRKCNNLKADLHPTLWRQLITHRPKYYKEFDNHVQVRRAAFDLDNKLRRQQEAAE